MVFDWRITVSAFLAVVILTPEVKPSLLPGFKPRHEVDHQAGNHRERTRTYSVPALSILPPESEPEHHGYPAPVETPQKFYSRPEKHPEVTSTFQGEAKSTFIPEEEISPKVMDASYSFSYDNDIAARHETADQFGNINGEYTYINSEGNQILVRYSAGADRGFVIENESELSNAVDKATVEGTAQPLVEEKKKKALETAEITFVGPNIDDSTWIQDKTYTFGFRGAETSRSETSDENGNVRGTYTIPDIEGKPILVRYVAGPRRGYVIENLEEVQKRTGQISGLTSSLAAAPSDVNTIVRTSQQPQLPSQPQQAGFVTTKRRGQTQASGIALDIRQGQNENVYEKNVYDEANNQNVDRSYNFQFGESDIKRKEEADQFGNVRGQYEYTNAEGNTILVTYSAGPNKGFVIENEQELKRQLSKATRDGAETLNKIRGEGSNVRKVVRKGGKRNQDTSRAQIQTYIPPVKTPAEEESGSIAEMDASFSFNYDTQETFHEESADETGERIGSYSYTSPEGKNILVRYRAGRKGFVILNPEEVLPKAF